MDNQIDELAIRDVRKAIEVLSGVDAVLTEIAEILDEAGIRRSSHLQNRVRFLAEGQKIRSEAIALRRRQLEVGPTMDDIVNNTTELFHQWKRKL